MKLAHYKSHGRYRSHFICALVLLCVLIFFTGSRNAYARESGMIVRISEIEIFPTYLQEYRRILQEEASSSLIFEPGGVSIFPVFSNDSQNQMMIVEIYVNRDANESHIKSPHFQKYKTTTLEMVKSLKLVDMQALDPNSMPLIFKKMSDK